MASSSSSRKQVFLSFRGEDTRANILSHLRGRLDDEGIDTFKDDTEMERGEEIGPSLLRAIESSTIALVILSKGYASSKWCLDELVKIMECRDRRELKVIPIFYHVDPSDCRNPTTGIFAADFAIHDKKSKEKAKLWKTAMAQVANLSGHHLKNFRWETELLDEVIADVQKILKPLPVRANSLAMPDQVRVIVGGIGNATIFRVTFEEIFPEVDAISFCVEETPRELGRPNCCLNGRVISQLLDGTGIINIPFVGGLCDAIFTRLYYKRVLIVLDGVNNSELDGQYGSFLFGPGSIITVTGRKKICSDDSTNEVTGLYEEV